MHLFLATWVAKWLQMWTQKNNKKKHNIINTKKSIPQSIPGSIQGTKKSIPKINSEEKKKKGEKLELKRELIVINPRCSGDCLKSTSCHDWSAPWNWPPSWTKMSHVTLATLSGAVESLFEVLILFLKVRRTPGPTNRIHQQSMPVWSLTRSFDGSNKAIFLKAVPSTNKAARGANWLRCSAGHMAAKKRSFWTYSWTLVVPGANFGIKFHGSCGVPPPVDVINHRPIDTCTWCNQNEIPCWDHLAWSCQGFVSTRPPVPGDALQRVLGWPVGHHSDQVVLTHLSRVRSKLLDKRYRGAIWVTFRVAVSFRPVRLCNLSPHLDRLKVMASWLQPPTVKIAGLHQIPGSHSYSRDVRPLVGKGSCWSTHAPLPVWKSNDFPDDELVPTNQTVRIPDSKW